MNAQLLVFSLLSVLLANLIVMSTCDFSVLPSELEKEQRVLSDADRIGTAFPSSMRAERRLQSRHLYPGAAGLHRRAGGSRSRQKSVSDDPSTCIEYMSQVFRMVAYEDGTPKDVNSSFTDTWCFVDSGKPIAKKKKKKKTKQIHEQNVCVCLCMCLCDH